MSFTELASEALLPQVRGGVFLWTHGEGPAVGRYS
jgi:hypothetical protein